MAKEKFEDRKLTGRLRIKLDRDDHSCGKYWEADKAEFVDSIRDVIEDFERQGYKLTLRQLYYQLVQRNYLANDDKCYGKLSAVLDDCRYSGKVDWDSIEDRGRVPHDVYTEESVSGAIENALRYYNLDKREGQPIYVELWSEKDAISNILKEAVRKYTITVGINKGFASSTAIYNAYQRFAKKIKNGQKVVVLYLGDHDPSGLSMIEDIKRRLVFMFQKGDSLWKVSRVEGRAVKRQFDDGAISQDDYDKWVSDEVGRILKLICDNFEIRHIGLTMDQIQEYNLPPNPAKMSDPRAKKYVEEFGEISWEVDALQPKDLKRIILEELDKIVDQEIYDKVLRKEQQDRKILKKLVEDTSSLGVFSDPDERGMWICPHCGELQFDPENIRQTQCSRCEIGVYLSDVVEGKRKAKRIE